MKDKSKVLNIFIIVLALALIVLLIVKGGKKEEKDNENMESDTSALEENTNLANGESFDIPMPTEDSWTMQTGVVMEESQGKLNFSVPEDYFVSYPVIGECSDVVSISTATYSDPAVPIALIYKEGCVQNDGVTNVYTQRQVKDGYVFQTNSTNATVLSIFSKIVESANVQ